MAEKILFKKKGMLETYIHSRLLLFAGEEIAPEQSIIPSVSIVGKYTSEEELAKYQRFLQGTIPIITLLMWVL